MEVYKAISAVQKDLSEIGISKDRTAQGYKFRGIDDVYGALAPALAKHSLCILPRVLSREATERVSKSGTTMFYVTVECEFDMVSAVDGSKHTIRTIGEAMDTSDKATNKAMSAAYKYAAFQTFCIPLEGRDSEEDDHKPASDGKSTGTAAKTAQKQSAAQSSSRQQETPPKTTNISEIRDAFNDADKPSDEQRRKMFASAKESGYVADDVKELIATLYNKQSTTELSKKEMSELIDYFAKNKKAVTA